MNVLNYIRKQGERIRDRHEGDVCVYFKGESAPVCRSAVEVLEELNNLEGLNESERAFYSGRRINTSRAREFAF
ncbi:MAG: hypothetical protein ACI4QN_01525 [Candidatus Coproplasma sp.]